MTENARKLEVPLYEQIYDDIYNKIAVKEWKPGQRIPSEMQLCNQYGVSRITVRKAIDDMVHSGYLNRQRGKGTFVQKAPVENKVSKFFTFGDALKSKGIKETAEMLSFDIVTANHFLSEKLELTEPNQCLFKILRLRCADGVPFVVETSYVPENIMPELTECAITENGLYNTMRALGCAPDRAARALCAVAVEGLEAKLLQQEPKTPAMHIERLTYSGKTCVEYCRCIVRGDFFVYTVELP